MFANCYLLKNVIVKWNCVVKKKLRRWILRVSKIIDIKFIFFARNWSRSTSRSRICGRAQVGHPQRISGHHRHLRTHLRPLDVGLRLRRLRRSDSSRNSLRRRRISMGHTLHHRHPVVRSYFVDRIFRCPFVRVSPFLQNQVRPEMGLLVKIRSVFIRDKTYLGKRS